jgi:hypothetical protein
MVCSDDTVLRFLQQKDTIMFTVFKVAHDPKLDFGDELSVVFLGEFIKISFALSCSGNNHVDGIRFDKATDEERAFLILLGDLHLVHPLVMDELEVTLHYSDSSLVLVGINTEHE